MEDADNQLNILILDACRDNPLARQWRASQRGLAVIQAARGSLIAYATAPGTLASDGDGRNGLYTSYLLRQLSCCVSILSDNRWNVTRDRALSCCRQA
jgi:uncharacterized caspase-like protein